MSSNEVLPPRNRKRNLRYEDDVTNEISDTNDNKNSEKQGKLTIFSLFRAVLCCYLYSFYDLFEFVLHIANLFCYIYIWNVFCLIKIG